MKSLIGIGVLLGLVLCAGLAQAGTKLVWDRNTDDAANYKVYACVTKGCPATKTATLLKATVPQVAVGAIPQWLYPVNTEGQGCITAVDGAGNESACSVPANFDGLAPAVPQNVIEQ
jgi:hypothetical protein